MPFVTEEIWQQLPKPSVSPQSIMITLYPNADPRLVDEDVERRMQLAIDCAVAVRAVRAEYNVPPSQNLAVRARVGDAARREALGSLSWVVERSSRSTLSFVDEAADEKHAAKVILGGDVELVIPLAGLIDLAAERARLLKEAGKAEKEIETIGKKLANQGFVDKAPAEVVEKERARLADEQARVVRLRQAAEVLA